LVFVTRYSGEVLTKLFLVDLLGVFACGGFEAEMVKFDVEDEHVGLLATYLPKVDGSTVVNSLK
jgi:REP element-mobilizing transposase RayT